MPKKPIGQFFHRVTILVSVYICLSPFHVISFEASHRPSGQIRVADRHIVIFFNVFGGFKRVFLVLLLKEGPYLSALKQELLHEI